MVNKLIKEDTRMFLTGNEVLAYAANSAEADFMYGYPIQKPKPVFCRQKMKFRQDSQQ